MTTQTRAAALRRFFEWTLKRSLCASQRLVAARALRAIAIALGPTVAVLLAMFTNPPGKIACSAANQTYGAFFTAEINLLPLAPSSFW